MLALEPSLCKLRPNTVLGGITLRGAITSSRYTAYGDDISTLLTGSAKIEEVGKEIRTYDTVVVGFVKSFTSPGPLQLDGRACKIFGVLFGPDIQLENNWSEVLEKVIAAVNLWP